jgi:hypothetical protein
MNPLLALAAIHDRDGRSANPVEHARESAAVMSGPGR